MKTESRNLNQTYIRLLKEEEPPLVELIVSIRARLSGQLKSPMAFKARELLISEQ